MYFIALQIVIWRSQKNCNSYNNCVVTCKIKSLKEQAMKVIKNNSGPNGHIISDQQIRQTLPDDLRKELKH